MNKASGGDEIPVELFQNPKDDAVKNAALNMPTNLEKSAVATGLKKSAFIPIPKKGNGKECSNYCTIALILHDGKVMLKILQARLQYYMNKNFQLFKLDLEKAKEPEIKMSTSIGF